MLNLLVPPREKFYLVPSNREILASWEQEMPAAEQHENSLHLVEWLGPIGGENPDPAIWQGKVSAKFAKIQPRFEFSDELALQHYLDKL